MECRDARELAEPFISEQLLVETTQEIVRHLDRCHPCRSEFEAQRRLRAATRTAFDRSPGLQISPAFAAALTTRLRAEAAPPGRPRRWRTWVAAAAAVVVVAGAGVHWRAGEHLSALARLALGDHQNCALRFRLAERPISLEDAQRRYGGRFEALRTVEPAPVDLPAGPLRILERHACVFEGRRFAHLVLEYQGTPVSVLVTGDDAGGGWWNGTSPHLQEHAGGFRSASFHRAGYAVVIVSALPEAGLDDVVRAMAGPVSRALEGV